MKSFLIPLCMRKGSVNRVKAKKGTEQPHPDSVAKGEPRQLGPRLRLSFVTFLLLICLNI